MTSDGVMRAPLADLLQLRPQEFRGEMTQSALVRIFQACDALWLHSGDPEHPHAELTSGKCSNGFVDTLRVLTHTNLCTLFAQFLLREVYRNYDGLIGWSIGSDHAGAALSHEVGRLIGCRHDFTEKGPDKTQLWKRFTIEPDEVVLQVEELVTTTGTLKAVREGIRTGNAHPVQFASVVATLVHRSQEYELEGAPIVHLVHLDIEVWDPDKCPLCAAGSKRLRPKQNWTELTAHG